MPARFHSLCTAIEHRMGHSGAVLAGVVLLFHIPNYLIILLLFLT